MPGTTVQHGLAEDLRPPLTAGEALVEADRCLGCGGPYAPAPCTVACPADVDVPGFVGQIAAGDTHGAAGTIFEENVLGGTCARVCPVEILCEGSCVLTAEGRAPVAIGQLQRFATDDALRSPDAALSDRFQAESSGHAVAVIGAGPAGLAAAAELALAGHAVAVFDERDEPGGLARYAIAPFRLRSEPLDDEVRAVEALGVQVHRGVRVDSADQLVEIAALFDAVLLAVGMGADVHVAYPGDDLDGVYESLPFIEALKRGEPLPVGERVVVIGGGNTAIDCAREARRLGADVVTLAYRRTEDEMPAFAHEVAEAREEDVQFHYLANPQRLLGADGRVEGVECMQMRLGAIDESGRHRPEPVPGSAFVIAADTVIKAVGQQARTELERWIDGVRCDGGPIQVDPDTGATGAEGFFAAGDAISGGSIVVEAVRTAKIAARGIDAWLKELTP